jgi:hypothetical protein
VTEAAVRKRAKSCGWVKMAADAKRQLVDAAMAGLGSRDAHQGAAELVAEQALEDAQTLRMSSSTYAGLITRLSQMSLSAADAREIKAIAEATRIATDGYMRARGLDKDGGEAKRTTWEGTWLPLAQAAAVAEDALRSGQMTQTGGG